MKDLLVVVDMVNGFVKGGALADPNINKITPAIIAKIEKAKKEGATIIAFRDCHEENDEEFKSYPPHCIKGTWESELIDELKPYEKDMIIIDKNTTNGFNTKKMREILDNNNIKNIDITGCCTDICVYDLATSLMRHNALKRISMNISVSENCVDTFTLPGHDANEVNQKTLKELEELGVNVFRNSEVYPVKVKKITNQKFLNLFEVTYQGKNGDVKYEMVTRRELPEVVKPSINPDAVHIIPYSYVNGSMVVYLIKEFRYPVGDYVYAVPAGLVNEGEEAIESAKRELGEEIGAEVVNIKRTETSAYSSVGMSDERAEMYEAEVKLTEKQHLDNSEEIEVVPVKLDELEPLLDNEKFGARSKYGLRSFIYKQKIKELEKKLQEVNEEREE